MRYTLLLFALLAPVIGSACGEPEPPLRPKWDVDVLPILKGNCFHCHGQIAEVSLGLPLTRLDMCKWAGAFSTKFMVDPGAIAVGARDTVGSWLPIVRRDAPVATAMPPPPAFPLSDYELEVLERWARLPEDQACTKQNPNVAPRYQVLDGPKEEDGQIEVVIDVWDPDGDTVFGTVKLGSAEAQVLRSSGRHTLRFAGASANDQPVIDLFDGYDTTTSN